MTTPNASDLFGSPFEVTIAGRVCRVAPLSVGDLFGQVEAEVRRESAEQVREIGEGIADPQRRAEFYRNSLSMIPSGESLLAAVQSKIATFGGIRLVLSMALRRAGDALADEPDRLAAMLTPESLKELAPLTLRLCGMLSDPTKAPPAPPPATPQPSPQ